MLKKIERNKKRIARHYKVRNKIVGTPERPRLNVYRSSKNIYAQIVDDATGTTLVSASTQDKEIASKVAELNKVDAAKVVGAEVAKRAQEKGIKNIVFDRGGYLYHGRIKSLADSARENGLDF